MSPVPERSPGGVPARGSAEPALTDPFPAAEPPAGGSPTGSTGGFPAVTGDSRGTGAADPLSDGPIESSYDVGTPLAEQSWESIRRGFDRLKEDTRNWDSAYRGIGTGLDLPAGDPAERADRPGDDDRP